MNVTTPKAIDNVAKLLSEKNRAVYFLDKHDTSLSRTVDLMFDEKICIGILNLIEKVKNDKDIERERALECDKEIVDALMDAINNGKEKS